MFFSRDCRESSSVSLTSEHEKPHTVALQGLSPCSVVFFLSPLSTIMGLTECITEVCVIMGLRFEIYTENILLQVIRDSGIVLKISPPA